MNNVLEGSLFVSPNKKFDEIQSIIRQFSAEYVGNSIIKDRAQEDERMEQIQRLRTEKDQAFQPVKKDTDNLQAVMDTVGGAGDVMHLSQNVVETFIDRIEVFNDESVKIRFTFEDVLKNYEAE